MSAVRPSALLALIGRLLEQSPERRAAITEVERAAWVNQDVALERYSWASVLPDTGRSLPQDKVTRR